MFSKKDYAVESNFCTLVVTASNINSDCAMIFIRSSDSKQFVSKVLN